MTDLLRILERQACANHGKNRTHKEWTLDCLEVLCQKYVDAHGGCYNDIALQKIAMERYYDYPEKNYRSPAWTADEVFDCLLKSYMDFEGDGEGATPQKAIDYFKEEYDVDLTEQIQKAVRKDYDALLDWDGGYLWRR